MRCVKCGVPIYPGYLTLCNECKRKEAEKRPAMTFENRYEHYSTENRLIGKFKEADNEHR